MGHHNNALFAQPSPALCRSHPPPLKQHDGLFRKTNQHGPCDSHDEDEDDDAARLGPSALIITPLPRRPHTSPPDFSAARNIVNLKLWGYIIAFRAALIRAYNHPPVHTHAYSDHE